MDSPSDAIVEELISGAVDTHMHTAPDVFPRHDTDHTAAQRASDRGMRGIVIKNHHFETASRAALARERTDITVLGGITLNEWVGGLNPHAVDGAAQLDASIVWMPTITARNHLDHASIDMFTAEEQSPDGISVLSDGELTDPAHAVLERIEANDLVVGLSHLAPQEAMELVRVGANEGIEEFVVQHPHAHFLDYSFDQMQQITDLGATLEFHYICTTEMMGHAATIQDFARAIDKVGPENVILATDGGATENPPAMDMFEAFVREMVAAEVPWRDIETMIGTNPARVFDL